MQDAYEFYPTYPRQFRVDDNKPIWYAGQNKERLFGPPDPVYEPILRPKSFYPSLFAVIIMMCVLGEIAQSSFWTSRPLIPSTRMSITARSTKL